MRSLLLLLCIIPSGLCLFGNRNKVPWNRKPSLTAGNDGYGNKPFPSLRDNIQSRNGPRSFSEHSRGVPYLQRTQGRKSSEFSKWHRSRTNALSRPGFQRQRISTTISRTPFGKRKMTQPPNEVLQILPKAISEVRRAYGKPSTTTTTTTTEPPVIWFPNQSEECEQGSGGGGFSTFSLLALMMSATNLVGLLASNANNNINNNNNDNNVNNNNVQESNENNANNNENIFTMITMAPGRRRKRKRRKRSKTIDGDTYVDMRNSSMAVVDISGVINTRDSTEPVTTEVNDYGEDGSVHCWEDDIEEITAEEISSIVSLEFLRGHVRSSLTEDPECLLRNLCVINVELRDWGDIATALAKAFSEVHVKSLISRVPALDIKSLLAAAEFGRISEDSRDCLDRYQCPPKTWTQLINDQTVLETIMESLDSVA